MPRISRAVAVGYPHHIVQIGNNRGDVFFDIGDREKYLSLLNKYSNKWNSPILSYCLMTNHVHLLSRPLDEVSLHKMMQGVTLCYTQYFNRKYERTGRLWESRYYSCIVDNDSYLWAVARYIEQNPVRAGLVNRVEDFEFSSARAHINGKTDKMLGEELFAENQRIDYAELIQVNITKNEINEIRHYTRVGRPLGNEQFVSQMEAKLQRNFFLRPPGRPKKKEV